MLPFEDVVRQRPRFPVITLAIVLVNVLVFAYELSLPRDALAGFILTWGVVPSRLTGVGDEASFLGASAIAATLVTSAFVHAGPLHLFVNVLFLWVFGDNVESSLGRRTYLGFYVLCGAFAAFAQVAVDPQSETPGIGASGAVAGVLAAYLVLFPHARIRTLLFVGPFVTLGWVAAVVLIGSWFVLQVAEALLSLGAAVEEPGGVAFFAHVGGFLAGLALVLAIRRERHQPLVGANPLHGFLWTDTVRNWAIAAVVFLLALGLASVIGVTAPAGGAAMRSGAMAAAAGFAIFDGLRRLAGASSFLGPGRGLPRLLAIAQLVVAAILLLAALSL